MKYKNNYIYILLALLTISCVGVQPIALESYNEVSYKPGDYSGRELTDTTVLFDFSEGTDGWFTWSPKFRYSVSKKILNIACDGVGPNYPSLNAAFPLSNLTKTPIVRVRMRIEGEKEAGIRLDFIDAKGTSANSSALTKMVQPNQDFKYYYYNFDKGWTQTYPENAFVDSKSIESLQLYVNPGMEEWSGKLFIDEITVLPSDGSEILIDAFDQAINMWWPCLKENVSVARTVQDELKVSFNNGYWDCFGKIFGEMDVTDFPIIKVVAKAESTHDDVAFTNISARYIDANDNPADLRDGANKGWLTVNDGQYKTFYSVFKKGDESYMYSTQGSFDEKRVNRIILFINMIEEYHYVGDVFIDSVMFIKELPKDAAMILDDREFWGETPLPLVEWKAGEKTKIMDLTKSWKSNSTTLSAKSGTELVIESNGAGKNYEFVESKIAPANLDQSTLAFKVIAKKTGKGNANLRLDLGDDRGYWTNGRPVEVVINKDGYEEYFFKFNTNSYQKYPTLETVNSKAIEGIRFYVNPGLENFTGSITIKSLELVSLNAIPAE